MRKDFEVVDTERMVRMNLKAKASLVALIFAICCASSTMAAAYAGIVSIDTVDARPGQSVVVPIRLTNNDAALAGAFLPVKYDTSMLTLDSVSFVGSLLVDNMTGSALVDLANQTVEISYLPPVIGVFPLPTVTAPSGIFAKVYFHLALTAPAGYLTLDTVNRVIDLGNGSTMWTRLYVTDATGEGAGMMLPGFVPGAINVLVPTGVNDNGSSLPHEFALQQNYPNPFNPSTVIKFSLPMASHVKMDIFNILGQNVITLLDENMAAGNHQVNFDASSYPSGIYFYRWTHTGGSETRKMILVK
jgi:hypothetical protein